MQNAMGAENFEELRDKVTFISGNSKNSGKTTFLNYLLPRMRLLTEFAFLTIGVDGERKDQIFGTDKPVIETEKGDVFLSCENLLNKSDGSFSILQVFPWRTVLGKLVLVRTERRALIEIAGPENNSQLEDIIRYIRETLEIKTVLIDGAVNRITQVSSSNSAGFYYICKITQENISSSIDKLKVIYSLYEINLLKDVKLDCETLYIHEGAFTKRSILEIPENTETIVLEDFTKFFISNAELGQLKMKYSIRFTNKLFLHGFIINLYNINIEEFKKHLCNKSIIDKCIFNPYKR